jgi:spore coat protein U-like protein
MNRLVSTRLACGFVVAGCSLVTLGSTGEAATTHTTLAATLKVVASCQVSKSVALTFSDITGSGAEQKSPANGSVTYNCDGIAPTLSASDRTTTNDDFTLKGAKGTIPFTLCAIDAGLAGRCVALKNGDGSDVAVAESGTELIHGEVDRGAKQTYKLGNYTDAIVVTLSF